MTPLEIVALLALTGWAVYRQTTVSEIQRGTRFKMAFIYAGIGVVVGGFAVPHGVAGWSLVLGGLALSAIVGVVRGRLTRVWIDQGGRTLRQGTAVTVTLFLALVAVKFGLGAFAEVAHIDDGEGFGAAMVMIAVMIAVQAEIVWRRAGALHTSDRAGAPVLPFR